MTAIIITPSGVINIAVIVANGVINKLLIAIITQNGVRPYKYCNYYCEWGY